MLPTPKVVNLKEVDTKERYATEELATSILNRLNFYADNPSVVAGGYLRDKYLDIPWEDIDLIVPIETMGDPDTHVAIISLVGNAGYSMELAGASNPADASGCTDPSPNIHYVHKVTKAGHPSIDLIVVNDVTERIKEFPCNAAQVWSMCLKGEHANIYCTQAFQEFLDTKVFRVLRTQPKYVEKIAEKFHGYALHRVDEV